MTDLATSIENALRLHSMDVSAAQAATYGRLLGGDITFLKERGFSKVSELSDSTARDLKTRWVKAGNKASTINSKVAAWRAVFKYVDTPEDFEVPHLERVKCDIQEQWWLHPDDEDTLVHWLSDKRHFRFAEMVRMITHQGLRVGEANRLELRHLGTDSMTVPGTKTTVSQASIPLFKHSAHLITWLKCNNRSNGKCFAFSDQYLMDTWNDCRDFLGVRHIKSSTMKSLRRTFAYRAIQAGMPTAVLQQVMRHKSITTTEGYLRIVGGGLVEESRKYL